MANQSKKIRKIAVATDFSENSDRAILKAIQIAKATKAHLILVHVIEKSFLNKTLELITPELILETIEEYATRLIKQKIHSLSRYKLKIDYKIISQGNPIFKLLQFSKKNKINLLVMGSHGKYSVRDSFVGTTAETVIEKTECPVLIVKSAPVKHYNKILVPIDFSNVSKKALNFALQLFPKHKIRLIHVGDYEFEDLVNKAKKEALLSRAQVIKIRKAILIYLNSKMKKFIQGYRKKLKKPAYTIALGYPAPTIINEADKSNFQLIVMGTQGHGRLHYLFMGSVANWVLTEIDKDILLVPPKTAK